MQQELDVAGWPEKWRCHGPHDGRTGGLERATDSNDRRSPHSGVTDHSTATIDLFAARFELWLYEQHHVCTWRSELCGQSVRHNRERYEGKVGDDYLERFGVKGLEGGVSQVAPFEYDHAGVGAQLAGELSVTHVYAPDAACIAFEEAIGESTRCRTGVEAAFALDRYVEPLHRSVQLVAATRDEASRFGDYDRLRARNHSRGLFCDRARDEHSFLGD